MKEECGGRGVAQGQAAACTAQPVGSTPPPSVPTLSPVRARLLQGRRLEARHKLKPLRLLRVVARGAVDHSVQGALIGAVLALHALQAGGRGRGWWEAGMGCLRADGVRANLLQRPYPLACLAGVVRVAPGNVLQVHDCRKLLVVGEQWSQYFCDEAGCVRAQGFAVERHLDALRLAGCAGSGGGGQQEGAGRGGTASGDRHGVLEGPGVGRSDRGGW